MRTALSHRGRPRGPCARDGTITPDRPDRMSGTDLTPNRSWIVIRDTTSRPPTGRRLMLTRYADPDAVILDAVRRGCQSTL